MSWTLLEILWICYVSLLVYLMPFTKVEESFNMQAVHDLLIHGSNITAYDHKEFPGVVPRTFIGPIILAALVKPFQLIFQTFHFRLPHLQLLVRLMLGWVLSCCLIAFKRSLLVYYEDGVRQRVARNFMLICLSQFHLAFYCSRPLPNVFALAITLLALAHYLRRSWIPFIIYAGVAILLFRSELALLFGPLLLIKLVQRQVSILLLCLVAVPTLILTIGISVLVDSFFWGEWIWPEGYVFWYNTVLNMSHNWGTQPFLWYFYSVLPRCLLFSLPLAIIGGVQSFRSFHLLMAALIFLFLYSWLPHKELRFVIYVLPILNALAAKGLETGIAYGIVFIQQIMGMYQKETRLFLKILLYSHMLLNIFCSLIFIMASFHNYPGGTAMVYLHDRYSNITTTDVSVHIGNYAAQTGVTRFLHENPKWRYNKTEGLENQPDVLQQFTFLLFEINSAHPSLQNGNETVYLGLLPKSIRQLLNSHQIVATFSAFNNLDRSYPFVRLQEKLALLAKHDVLTS